MQMEAGLDTGPMLLKRAVQIEHKNAGELTDELAQIGAFAILQCLNDIERYPPVPQPDEGVTYAPKISKAEARLDFTQPAQVVERQVRAFNPMPGAFFEFMGERIKVLEAQVVPGSGPAGMVADQWLKIACGERAIQPIYVQRAGRAEMHSSELLRGFPIPKGAQLNPPGMTTR
jgi:methionyl-tRNA formyltransferase